MGSIELKMMMLTGSAFGLIFVLAMGIAMRHKTARYIMHLRDLRRDNRTVRLYTEVSGVLVVVISLMVFFGMLAAMTLGNFTPQYSDHAMSQLKHGLHQGN